MPVYPVATAPTMISRAVSKRYVLRNSGSVPVYLGQNSSLSVPNREITIDVGGSLNWESGTELWAIVEAGEGQVEVLFTGDTVVTPGPPAPDKVYGRAVVQQELITTQVLNAPYAAGTYGDVINIGDVSNYASIYMEIAITRNGTGGGSNPDYRNWLGLTATYNQQYSRSTPSYKAGFLLCGYGFGYIGTDYGASTWRIPVTGKILYLRWEALKLASGDAVGGFRISINIYGTNVITTRPEYVHNNSALAHALVDEGWVSITTSSALQFYTASKNVETTVSLLRNGGTSSLAGFDLSFCVKGNKSTVTPLTMTPSDPGFTVRTVNVQFPCAPLLVESSPTESFRYMLTNS